MRILGVDPGSQNTGYGCISKEGPTLRHIAHGTLRVAIKTAGELPSLEDRLLSIYRGLSEIILEFKPEVLVIEKVFFAKNPLSALKLGQARGAAILTGKIHSLSIAEYSPTEMKRIVAGHGQADKEQIAKIVQMLLGKLQFPSFDASDGLALALCHAFCSTDSPQKKHLRALQSSSTQRSKKRLSLAEAVGATLPRKVKL